jgi:hypothetical protein
MQLKCLNDILQVGATTVSTEEAVLDLTQVLQVDRLVLAHNSGVLDHRDLPDHLQDLPRDLVNGEIITEGIHPHQQLDPSLTNNLLR